MRGFARVEIGGEFRSYCIVQSKFSGGTGILACASTDRNVCATRILSVDKALPALLEYTSVLCRMPMGWASSARCRGERERK